jgi:hypothetical protein
MSRLLPPLSKCFLLLLSYQLHNHLITRANLFPFRRKRSWHFLVSIKLSVQFRISASLTFLPASPASMADRRRSDHYREHHHRSGSETHHTSHTLQAPRGSRLNENSRLPALSGDDDYVRQWLVQTNSNGREGNTDTRRSRVDQANSG